MAQEKCICLYPAVDCTVDHTCLPPADTPSEPLADGRHGKGRCASGIIAPDQKAERVSVRKDLNC